MIYINGEFVTKDKAYININDRGFLLGDGIFETIKVSNGKLYNFSKHFERLQASAKFFSIPFTMQQEVLLANCKELLKLCGLTQYLAAIRITLTRGKSSRGIDIEDEQQYTLLITATPYEQKESLPLTAYITSIIKNEYSAINKHKTLNYMESILARNEAKKYGYDEGIMLNTKGYFAEASVANIFFIKDDIVITPKLSDGILPGITRQLVIDSCIDNNINMFEQSIHPDELNKVSASFLTNSLIGIKSITNINTFKLNKNQIIMKISTAYDSLISQN